MTINATAPVLLCMLVAAASRQGVKPEQLSGTVQNDILKEYLARGNYIFPPEGSMRLVTDTFAYCAEQLPRWNSISISGYHIREAGATAVQEIAFTFVNAIAYLEAARAAGLDLERILTRVSFFFVADTDFCEEIAKFRCARRLWAHLVRDRFGVNDPKAQRLRFHVQTSGASLTAQQPENNIIRTTLQTLAAVLGGTQSLHVNAMDEALALPTRNAATLALRTQQIVAEESGVANTVDPVGGAWFIEAMTDRIEADVLAYIDKVDDLGGAVEAIRSGFLAREIHDSAYRRQRRLESGENVIVGVNRYRDAAEQVPIPIQNIPEELERGQCERLARHRATVDTGAVRSALAAVEETARSDRNLFPDDFRHPAPRVRGVPAERCHRLTETVARCCGSTTCRPISPPRRGRSPRSTGSASRSPPANRSVWSANRAAARRSRRCRSCVLCRRRAGSSAAASCLPAMTCWRCRRTGCGRIAAAASR
jgi:methylmalonyl-CoA mutase N-terminal domain/subunit